MPLILREDVPLGLHAVAVRLQIADVGVARVPQVGVGPGPISRQEFEYRFRLPFGPLQEIMEQFERTGRARMREDRWCLTPEGFLGYSNKVLELIKHMYSVDHK